MLSDATVGLRADVLVVRSVEAEELCDADAELSVDVAPELDASWDMAGSGGTRGEDGISLRFGGAGGLTGGGRRPILGGGSKSNVRIVPWSYRSA